ncbi:pyruvate kinase [Algisphaera agarilytica]|uniref:Pyruvate kinase n=1 Tax=Algisphaera agarilytica TaxID=1385975 RepID=A0A7X0H5B9_9BACT|nr:pyruvate kinase [Algisphaera agarilytica]MBB6429578.1 pyruvate kinase [Algisphaera agarilytica]
MADAHSPLLLTKILATVGPASQDVGTLVRMIQEGARAFRVNFSHGDFPDFEKSVQLIRQASAESGVPVGILGDLSGPKIRVTTVENGKLELAVGDHVEFTQRDVMATRHPDTGVVTVGTTYPEMVDDVDPGQRLLVNDGAIRMLVTDKVTADDPPLANRRPDDPRLICRVTEGGTLSNKKGVNLPDTHVSAPALTDWDEECAAWAVENDIDFLALSFVRKAEDVIQLNDLLLKLGRDNRGLRSHSRLPIVSKIEKPQAIDELDAILDETDAVMVARGDLGVEMDLAQVPVIQKQIIDQAHAHGKPVIVATQMLESMIQSFTPTRAEVSDVANAILDGTDAIMLSGETAVGAHPVQAIHTMARTAQITEEYDAHRRAGTTKPPAKLRESKYRTAALAHGVSTIVNDLEPAFVVMWSELGGGARYLSQNRLRKPVITISSNESSLRQMALLFGVHPVHMKRPADTAEFLESVDTLLTENHWANPGDAVVIVKGEPLGTPGVTNMIRIHYVGDVCRITWHTKDD